MVVEEYVAFETDRNFMGVDVFCRSKLWLQGWFIFCELLLLCLFDLFLGGFLTLFVVMYWDGGPEVPSAES